MTRRASLLLLAAALFLATAGCDGATKALAQSRLVEGKSVPVVSGILELHLAYNRGVSFSFLESLGPKPIALGALALVGTVLWGLREAGARPLGAAALALVAAGGVCNAVDRLSDGTVTDMILVRGWPGIFNVADVAIVVGSGLLVLAARPEK